MVKIKGIIHSENYAVHLYSATNELVADEPVGVGGKDKGFSPGELLASSLAACTSITLRMYAVKKQWALEKTEVEVNMERDAMQNITTMERNIQLFGNLSSEQRTRLLEIANQCPIHKTLAGKINITTSLL